MRKTREEAEVTRENLLDAGLAVFSRKGYAKTTLNDIAKEVGVTRGAIYWHFGGKKELYNALVSERFSTANTMIVDILMDTNSTPLEKLRRLLVQSIAYVERDDQYRAVLELTLFKTEVTDEIEEMMKVKQQSTDQMIGELAKLIIAGQESGQFRLELEPQATAITALSLVNGMVTLWLLTPNSFKLSEHVEKVIDIFIRGISK